MAFDRLSATKTGNEAHGSFWFLVDNTRVAYVEGFEPDAPLPRASTTIILELTAGQLVQIENNYSTIIVGTNGLGMNSWFTGFLLYALE